MSEEEKIPLIHPAQEFLSKTFEADENGLISHADVVELVNRIFEAGSGVVYELMLQNFDYRVIETNVYWLVRER